MRYPTPGEYQEVLQFPATVLRDPELKAAVPEENPLGLPQVITGAFAAVFPMRHHERRWAVKCFLADVPDQQARYRAVSAHLQRPRLPYTVDFEYQPQGIHVNGRDLPLLKMAWVDGVPLNRFVADHLGRPAVLAGLAEAWAAMLHDLAGAGIAHGDLQHGNVLILPDGDAVQLRLVDYDTLYVPALKGRRSPEVGHRNYQHPDRDERDFGPYLDHFPGLVIYTALHACRLRPDLWNRYDTGENLLFRAADFYDPSASLLFEELDAVEELRPLVAALRTACYLEPEAVPALSAVLRDEVPGGSAVRTAATRRRRRNASPQRDRFERAYLPALAAGLVAAGSVLATGAVEAGLALLVVVAAGAAWTSIHRYRRLPAVRRRHRLEREVAYFDRMLESLQEQVQALSRERHAFVEDRAARYAKRLREVREEALEDRLKYHFVGEAGTVEGISHKVVVRMKVAGIRTAYQATPERMAEVRDISEESRARVSMWRAALVRQYSDEIPDTLSPAEERRLERFARQRLHTFDAEAARLQEKIDVQRTEKQQIEARRGEIPDISYGRYLRYLLRLTPLPPPRMLPSPPSPAPVPPHAAPPPAPPPAAEDERAWWRT